MNYGAHEHFREDRKRRECERLEAMLLAGLNSGPMTEMTREDWKGIREEVRQRIAARQRTTDGPATGEDR
jgi:hypothetical protein